MENDSSFGLLFKQISIAFSNNFQREAARYDLTPSQASILIYLSKVDHPVNQRELEKYFRLTNPTVTGLMQRMENKGFIRREMNQADNRSKYIILTPKAMEISAEVRNNLHKVEEDITSGAISAGVACRPASAAAAGVGDHVSLSPAGLSILPGG